MELVSDAIRKALTTSPVRSKPHSLILKESEILEMR